jgi:hypothetical protein
MSQNKIIVLSERKTQRLVYIFNLILKNLLGLNPEFVTNRQQISDSQMPVLCYGSTSIESDFFVAADDLLFERGIKETEINFGTYDNLPCFFQTFRKQSTYPFDLFAASFYLVSRYEEYLPYIKDKYGRFDAPQSLAFQRGFLNKPLVNIWAKDLAEKLKTKFPNLEIEKKNYKYVATIDVDAAFSYKQKGFWRTAGGYLKNLRDRQWADILDRTKVLRGKTKDPFDSFDYIFNLHKQHNLKPIFFVLFANYGTNDKNIQPHNRKFQSLIRRMMDYGHVGIHPSFTSNSQNEKVETEISRLSKVIHSEITKSRQHFLMLSFPETYNRVIELGITEDYTMGYASKPGFRASIASPFYFYNLEYEMVTALKIFPFAYMEGTIKDYMLQNSDQALEIIKALIDEVKAIDGVFISLWHNESLGGQGRWQGWPEIYEKSLKYGLEKK